MKTTVPKDYYIIEAAKSGYRYTNPMLWPPLEIVGACRLCLVEIENSPKLETACLQRLEKEW